MSLVETVQTVVKDHMADFAEVIEGELKSACPERSGEAKGSIGIEQMGEFSYRIGGENLHLYYADQGNKEGSRGGRIYPLGKALVFDGWGEHAGKGKGKGGRYVLPSVSAYDGSHFVREVADRHR